MESFKFGIITVSDSCYNKQKDDKSGPKLLELLNNEFQHCTVVSQSVVPDDISLIRNQLLKYCEKDLDVAFTTGGTGFAPSDVTPEATREVIMKEAAALSTAMLLEGMIKTPLAMLSRAVCGIRDKTLIINLSGSVKAVTEQFNAIKSVLPHAIALIKDNVQNVQQTHKNLQDDPKKEFVPSKVKIDCVAIRNRSSPYKMISVDEAYGIIETVCIQSSEVDVIDIRRAIGRVLAEDVRSFDPLPPFPCSIKDGYAVIAADGGGKRTVIDGVAAGDAPSNMELKPGECVRINTGGPVPPGADAVVQVEDTELISSSADNSKELEINIMVAPETGQDIRQIGSDIAAHCVVLKKDTLLNSPEIGILAAVGKMKIKVYKRPKIAIISTGNEIKDPADPLETGQIRDSNKITLLTLLEQYDYKSEDFGTARDHPDSVKQKLEEAFNECDFIITTGGVSMGEYDVIKRVLEVDFKAKIHFGRINMKPGKPTTLATCNYNGEIKTIFGLPGNPVSATVTCLLFVIPALKHCENKKNILYPKVRVYTESITLDERPEYRRIKLQFNRENGISGVSTGNQISSRLNSFASANGLCIIPAGKIDPNSGKYTQIRQHFDCYVIDKFL